MHELCLVLLALQACRCLCVLPWGCTMHAGWLLLCCLRSQHALLLPPLAQGLLATGGTTLIVHVLTATHVYTANVGDCKSVLSR